MANIVLKDILEGVKTLSPVDQRAVREVLDDLLEVSQAKDGDLKMALQESGLLEKINPPVTDLTPYLNRKPVKLKGQEKTASEIIIEERR